MTGFGRAEGVLGDVQVTVEVSSVNRKQADVRFSLPPELPNIELRLKKAVLALVSRGSVHVAVEIGTAAGTPEFNLIDAQRAAQLIAESTQLAESLGLKEDLTLSHVLKLPGVCKLSEDGGSLPEGAAECVETVLLEALNVFIESREAEGATLITDIESRLAQLRAYRVEISKAKEEVTIHHRDRLLQRLSDSGLPVDLDDERIIREIALFADKSDISEEVTRLETHFERFRSILATTEPIGRPLDFLCQEINREFNTIGSKAHSAEITRLIVDSKTELEKIREQVQNLE